MSNCQACGSKAIVFLCNSCTGQLREILEELPLWIGYLEDAAVGHVKLGDGGGGRSTARREPFKGDDEPPHGDPALLRRFLAAGGVNARAVDLLDEVRNSLSTWVRHLEESRGIVYVRAGFIGPLRAGHVRISRKPTPTLALVEYLTKHVQAIACDEGAGQCLAELLAYVGEHHTGVDRIGKIERALDRPIPRLYLGDCPTWFEDTRRVCGVELRASEGTIEVTCPGCRRVHKTDRLQLLMMSDLERKKLTVAEILALNARLPESERTPERTLRRWVRPGPKGEPPELKPNGYLRPCSCGHARVHHGKAGCIKCQQLGKQCAKFDGREVINRHSEADETLHKFADVRRLRVERPKRKARATA